MRYRITGVVTALLILLLVVANGAQAADGATPTVALVATSSTVTTGANVLVDIAIDFHNQPTLGGGTDIAFDPQRLQFVSFTFDPSLVDEPLLRRQPQVLSGLLKGLSFGSPSAGGLSGPLLIGRITFQAIGTGQATIAVSGNGQPVGGFVSATSFAVQPVNYVGSANSNAVTVTINPVAPGQLTGQSVAMPSNNVVNLTTEGTIDWVRWGRASASDIDRKANVTAQLSGLTPINSATLNRFGGNATYWATPTWSDGSPTATHSGNPGGVYTTGTGIQLTAPADTSVKTLKLYLGAWQARGKLDVRLSDASAPAYITYINNTADPVTTRIITLDYKAASASQTLTVKYTLDTDYAGGNIALQAATLSAPPTGNTAPILAPIGHQSIEINQTLSFTVTATDTNGDPVSLSATPLPSGASFIDLGNNSARFDWTPLTGAAGSYPVTVTANDGNGGSASEAITLTVTSPVNTAPTANPGGPYSGVANTAIAFTGSASSDPEGQALTYAWTFGDSACTPQPGCNTATLANPTHSYAVSNTYTVTLTVTDTGGLTNTRTTIATIAAAATGQLTGQAALVPANHTVNLTTEGTIDWVRWGRAIASDVDRKASVIAQLSGLTPINSATLNRFGGNATYWAMPTWSDGNPTATHSGNPGGVYTTGTGTGLQLTVPADTTARTLKLHLGAWQAKGKLDVRLSDASAPAYITYINNTADPVTTQIVTLSYRAASAGQTLTIQYTIDTDYGSGNIALQAATLSAPPTGNTAPALAPVGHQSIEINQTLSFTVTATDADNHPLTLTTSALPGTATFSDNQNGTGLFEWTPITGNAGSYNITFSVSDGNGGTDSQQITLTVTSPAATGQLTGQSVAMPSNNVVNLTTEGTTDWVRWGRATATDVDRKANVIARISDITLLNGAIRNRFGGNATYWATPTWSDGTPTATHSGNPGGVYTAGTGVQITMPAGTGLKTLKLYLGAWQAKGKLDVSLSDASAPAYITYINNTADPVTTRIITLDFKAASASQTLTVKYTLDTDYGSGNIALQAATLK